VGDRKSDRSAWKEGGQLGASCDAGLVVIAITCNSYCEQLIEQTKLSNLVNRRCRITQCLQ